MHPLDHLRIAAKFPNSRQISKLPPNCLIVAKWANVRMGQKESHARAPFGRASTGSLRVLQESSRMMSTSDSDLHEQVGLHVYPFILLHI